MESLNMVNGTHDKSSEERLPPGFRFHPTDEELVTYYLTKKILDSSFSGRAITEVDLNKCEPWDLPGKAKMGEKEWYFFSLRDRKYPTGLRTNRATEAGYWKTTGKDREIFNSRTSALVGMKKTLVFYKGRAPKGEKTNWVMHEYRLEGKFSYHRLPKNCKDEWVVCRIFQKSAGGKKNSMGLNRNSYLELDSPSLPSLLESPYNTNAVNEQETGSIESESGTSAKGHVSCFSTAMEAINNRSGTLIGPHHIQLQRGSNTNPADSAELSDMTRIIRNSSYMQTIMFNDPRFNMNMMPALSSLSNLRRDQNAMHPQQGIQQLPLPPPLLFSPMSALPSSSLTFNPADANISAQVGLPSNAMLRALANQPSANGISLNMEPSSSYGVHDKQGNDKSLGANGFHWVHDSSQQQQPQQQQQINMEGNGVSQSISAHEPVVSIQQETCLNTDMNEEMSSVVCNRLNRPYQVDPSSAAPVDLDSFWNY